MKKSSAISLLFGLLALSSMAALPASAEDIPKNGPPPEVGLTFTPTPRFVCDAANILELSFEDGSDFATVSANLRASASIVVNGRPICMTVGFKNPITVLDVKPIGMVILTDQSEFNAHAVHGKFPNGQEVWALWLEMVKDTPKVEYKILCDNKVARCI